ncbi:DMT family transporter [Rhodovibrio sodomensis]|nr:DMT family transporter [Rhodovibrio sodomensis]
MIPQHRLRGILIMLASAAAAVAVGGAIKAVDPDLPTATVAFLRFACALVLLAPLWWRYRQAILATPSTGTHVLRGLAGLVAVGLYFYTLGVLPLSTAIAAQFTAPLFVPPLAAWLLGERTSPLAYLGVALAVSGAILSAGPDLQAYVPAVALGLASAMIGALLAVHAKTMMNAGESLVTLGFWYTLAGTAGCGAWVLATGDWVPPDAFSLSMTSIAGVAGSLSAIFVLAAYRHLPSALFAALKLLPIPASAVTALVLFAEVPAPAPLFGMSLILAGIVISQPDLRQALSRLVRSAAAA